jgi:hypothetical protein
LTQLPAHSMTITSGSVGEGVAMLGSGVNPGAPVRRLRALALCVVMLIAGCGANTSHASDRTGGIAGKPGYLVYWDQNEEVDFASMPSGLQGQLMPAWDLNGQMCVLPDGSGRFVGGVGPHAAQPAESRWGEALQRARHRRGAQ